VSLLPGGDVKSVTVVKSSGDTLFDRSAESAVYKAAPLPQPSDPKAADALRDFQFIFKPE
jgi:colicin import membrane protein